MKQVVDISWVTIFRSAAAVVAVWLLWQIRDVLALFFIIVVLVAALAPVVDRWSEKMSRALAVSLIYLIILVTLSIIGSLLIPPLVHEIGVLSLNLPEYLSHYGRFFGDLKDILGFSPESLETISRGIGSIGAKVYSTTLGIFGTIVGFFTVVVVTFYLLLEKHGGRNLIVRYLPSKHREKVAELLHKIGVKMGAWLRGQLLLALIIGILDFIGMLVIGVPFALTLGVWAALTEIVPYIGPVLGAIPAVAIAFIDSPIKGLFTLILFVVVQQIEANVLVPKIMGKAVGLSPVIIIFAILVGAKLAGIVGVLLAVPAAAAISVLLNDLKKGGVNG